MDVVLVVVIAAVALSALVFAAGHRLLTGQGPGGGGTADALGGFIDVFDPARARADRDLESHKNMGEVLPSPDDDHPRWSVDLQRGTVRIPRER